MTRTRGIVDSLDLDSLGDWPLRMRETKTDAGQKERDDQGKEENHVNGADINNKTRMRNGFLRKGVRF